MPDLGPAELVVILIVCLLIFGGSRVAELGGSLGKGIKEFRNAMREDDSQPAQTAEAPPGPALESPAAVTAGAEGAPTPSRLSGVETARCSRCGTSNVATAKYCSECGAALATSAPS